MQLEFYTMPPIRIREVHTEAGQPLRASGRQEEFRGKESLAKRAANMTRQRVPAGGESDNCSE